MESSHRSLAICIAMLPVAATADEPTPAIISSWHKATADTTTVRASVRLIIYDDTFHIQKHATGTFGYLSPRHGFWRLNNDTTEHQKLRVTCTGVPYKIRPFDNQHWRWHTDRFRDINDNDKSFSEYKIDPNTKSYVRFFSADLFRTVDCYACGVIERFLMEFFSADLFRTVDWATPFLPGRPNKDVAREWTYSAMKQTDSHTWIRAIPKADTPLATSLRSCDIYFQRDPVRLLATRSTPINSEQQTVIIYSDVSFTPEPWSEPELTDYRQTNTPVQQAKAP